MQDRKGQIRYARSRKHVSLQVTKRSSAIAEIARDADVGAHSLSV